MYLAGLLVWIPSLPSSTYLFFVQCLLSMIVLSHLHPFCIIIHTSNMIAIIVIVSEK